MRLFFNALLVIALAVLALYLFINPREMAVTCTRGSITGLTTGCEPPQRSLTFEDIVPTSAPANVTLPTQPSPTPEPMISALPGAIAKTR